MNNPMKGIMFNEHLGLESAVLSGRKTMTRRVIKGTYNNNDIVGFIAYNKTADSSQHTIRVDFTDGLHLDSPYQVGEIIAIKQSYCDIMISNPRHKTLAIASKYKESAGWNNKMFVKNDLMPHKIKITNIRVERLQDISEDDCLAEGVSDCGFGYFVKGIKGIRGCQVSECYSKGSWMIYDTPTDAFASLIDKVSGKGTWQSNPFVWVIEFELIKDKINESKSKINR